MLRDRGERDRVRQVLDVPDGGDPIRAGDAVEARSAADPLVVEGALEVGDLAAQAGVFRFQGEGPVPFGGDGFEDGAGVGGFAHGAARAFRAA